MHLEIIVVFLSGLAVGFVGAVPLGPLGIICIRRTLKSGFAAAVIGGLGTATADAVFGIISAFGLTYIAQWLHEMETPLCLAGGAFMLAMGIHVLTHKQQEISLQDGNSSLSHMGNIASNFFLTLTNPLTIIFFTVAFARLGIANNASWFTNIVVVLGVFWGSMLSWILLSAFITLKRNSRLLSNMIWINRITGVVLISCGGWFLGGVILPYL